MRQARQPSHRQRLTTWPNPDEEFRCSWKISSESKSTFARSQCSRTMVTRRALSRPATPNTTAVRVCLRRENQLGNFPHPSHRPGCIQVGFFGSNQAVKPLLQIFVESARDTGAVEKGQVMNSGQPLAELKNSPKLSNAASKTSWPFSSRIPTVARTWSNSLPRVPSRNFPRSFS